MKATPVTRSTFKTLAALGYPVRFFARLIFEFEPPGDPLFYAMQDNPEGDHVAGLVCWFDVQKLSTDCQQDLDTRAAQIQRELCENLGVVNIKTEEDYSFLSRKVPS